MKKKISIWTALILAGELVLGTGYPAIGIGNSVIFAASEFGITVSPAPGAAYVNIGSSLKLSFDRQVNPQNGEIIITPVDSNIPFVKIPIGSYGLIGSSTGYDLKWGNDLQLTSNKKYKVTIPAGLFKDNNGNSSALTTWEFTTTPENNTAIEASDFTPANNSRVDAGSLRELRFNLNKKLQRGGGTIRLLSSADNTTIQEFKLKDYEPRVDVQSDGSSTTVRLTLDKTLAAGAKYYVLIDSYALKDDDNRTYSGIASGNVWSFSTKGVAEIPVTSSPVHGAASVSPIGALSLTFDRPMMPATGHITVTPGNLVDGGTRWLDVNSPSVTGGNSRTITLNPASTASPLLDNMQYTVTIPKGAFYDQDGNLFPASGNYSWSFTTSSLAGLIPTLSPADRSESVDTNTKLNIKFNKDVMFNGGLSNGITLYKNGTVQEQIPVSVKQIGNAPAKEYEITPDVMLDNDSTYYINIAKGVFLDAAGSNSIYGGLNGLSSWSFHTTALDKVVPELNSVQLINNRTIQLKYNEALNASIALLSSSFPVTINEESRSVETVYTQGDSVFVVLSTGVAVGQVVRIGYSGGLRTIQDPSGNISSPFSLRLVTNTIDTALVTLKDARISAKTVVLNFSEALQPVSANSYYHFNVTADGYSLGVNSISSSGATITLGLTTEAASAQTVRVSYTAGAYPVLDHLSQNVSNFNEFYVRNTNDTTPPIFQSATGSGNKVVFNYNEGISPSSLPMNSQFSVLNGSTPNYVTNVAVSGTKVTLTLQNNLTTLHQNVTLSYVPGGVGLTDLNGNRAAYINLQPIYITDSTGTGTGMGTAVPDINSAVISGDEITVIFSKNMQATSSLYSNQFGVRADGSSIGVQSSFISGNYLKIILSSVVKKGQNVDLSYISGMGAIRDLNGNILPSFTTLSVQNQTDLSAGTGSRPSYLGIVPASEFGQEYSLLKVESSQITEDRSVYNQSVKKYSIIVDRLTASYEFLNKLGDATLVFEVPSTEQAAFVNVPLKPLLEAVNRNKNAKFMIRHGNNLFSVALNDIDMNDLTASLIADSNNISLVFRMERVPAGTFTPFEQKLQTQGMRTITSLMDVRVTAIISGNYSNAKALSVPGEYTVRTTSSLNGTQTSAARLDLAYYDAAYLPTKISTVGNYTVIRARTKGNLVLGTFLSIRSFTDMSNHWSNAIVAEMNAKNIIDSSYGNTFKPQQKITRAEFAVMLSRGLGLLGDREMAQRFRDVQPSTQTGDYIGAAAKAGIITGNTDGTFRPHDNITREQMAIMIIRAMEYTNHPIILNGTSASALSIFKDKSKIQSQSAEFVAKAVQSGIILGMSANVFQPQGNATRAQAAVMLQRMLKQTDFL